MDCPSCHTAHAAMGLFCTHCGAGLVSSYPGCDTCSAPLGPDDEFCGSCGLKVPKVLCFSCGKFVSCAAEACPLCSSSLTAQSPPSAEIETPTNSVIVTPLEPLILIYLRLDGLVELLRANPSGAQRYEAGFEALIARVAPGFQAERLATTDSSVLLCIARTSKPRDQSSVQALELLVKLMTHLRVLEEQRRSSGELPVVVRAAVYPGERLPAQGEHPARIFAEEEGDGAELVSFCPPDRVVVSETVCREVTGRFRERPVGLLRRPDAAMRSVSLVLGRRDVPPGANVPEAQRLPFVGRERELSLLRRRWSGVAKGKGSRLCTVVGGPGYGRTRLIETFLNALHQRGGAFASAACAEGLRRSPLAPIKELLCQVLGLLPDDDSTTLELRLRLAAQRALLAEGRSVERDDPEVIEITVLVGELLNADIACGLLAFNPVFLSPDDLRLRLFYALLRLLRGLSREQSLALVIEDIQLADKTTLELIEFLGATLAGDGQLLIICTTQPELLATRPGWGEGWERHEVVRLARLSAEELEPLIRAALLTPGAPARLVRDLVGAAQGRPGAAELISRAWLELQQERSEQGLGFETSIEGLIQAAYSLPPLRVREESPDGQLSHDDHGELGESTVQDLPVPPLEQPTVLVEPRRINGEGGPEWPDDEPLVFEEGEREDALAEEATVMVSIPGLPLASSAASPPPRGGSRRTRGDAVSARKPGRDGVVIALWQLRLSKLLRMARRVLELGAVLGPTFSAELMRSLWRLDQQPTEALGPLLLELSRLGFIIRRAEPTGAPVRWAFCGGGVFQVSYHSIPVEDRRQLHRTVARLLETSSGEGGLPPDYALLMRHYDAGEDFDRCVRYGVMAARQARRLLASEEAQALVERAFTCMRLIGFSERSVEQVSLRIMYARVLTEMHAHSRAIRELERAAELAKLLERPRLEAEAWMVLCELYAGRDAHVETLKAATIARDLALDSGHVWLSVQALHWIGFDHLHAERMQEAEQTFKLALKLASERGTSMMAVRARQVLALFDFLRGHFEQSLTSHQQMVEHLRKGLTFGAPPLRQP